MVHNCSLYCRFVLGAACTWAPVQKGHLSARCLVGLEVGRVVRQRGSVTLKDLQLRLTKFHGKSVTVGVDADAHYPDGTPVGKVAETQEFGYGHIPPRSFMRTTNAEKRQEWLAQMRFGAKLVTDGVETPETVLDTVGQNVVNDVKNKIREIDIPPLAPSTIKRREQKGQTEGLTKPLIETHRLINSITYEVK